ncbi:Choline transporter-like protein 1 [Nibea albiflora]|uniref:Choline transporter-like protein 1 n=1 Tax=Nibea albiflora TaxID=240163 RepID=A0ACB7ER77_NIBAL|nr:Choline transporter-like protein 1 [Nibea albiflora]
MTATETRVVNATSTWKVSGSAALTTRTGSKFDFILAVCPSLRDHGPDFYSVNPDSGVVTVYNRFVFFLDPCNIDIVQRKIKSMALCVSLCPTEELKTYQDLKRFAMLNAGHKYPGLPERFSKCPKLPVPPSKPLPVFNRCTPLDVSCYAKFAEAVVTFVGDNSVLHRLIAGVAASKEIIIGLCVLALVLSMILMVIIRYISAVLVWILTSLVVLGSLAGTSVLWWLYIDHRLYGNDTSTKVTKEVKEEVEVTRDSGQALLVYAAAATVFTVRLSTVTGGVCLYMDDVDPDDVLFQIILLLLMLFMRKRVALTIALFHVAGKVFIHLPLLTLQPFVTFLALLLFWIYWILVLLFLGTSGNPVQNEETGLTEFRLTGPLQYLTWYHAVGLVWITEFILACQQMTVAGAVVTYYFTRDKNRLPVTPILSSVLRLVRYHLGTVAKGSFIITLVKIPRLILMYIHNQLKGKNAYAATAINSTSFCTSARDAFVILVENALRVATINAVGDFVLFLGKILIVTSTAFAGVLLLNYQRDYAEWLLPLIIVCLFSFLVAHCFLSIFEIVVDVLFLCFAIDTKYNDGTPGKEFFMDKALMVRWRETTHSPSVTRYVSENCGSFVCLVSDLCLPLPLIPPLPMCPCLLQEFVESSRRLERAVERGRSRVKEVVSEGAEMKPMVSDSGGGGVARRTSSPEGMGLDGDGGEWEELQEFQVYYLLVGVLVDWVLTEQSGFVLCLSEDVVLFLCVYLPTSTLFLFVSLLHTPSPAPSSTKSAAVTAAC